VRRTASADLGARPRLALALQREITRLLSPVSFLLIWVALRVVGGYRCEGLAESRRQYRAIVKRSDAPMLVCANHLTLIDSFLITWALGSPFWFMLHFSAVPWNVPERLNFAARPWQRALIYVLKCIPIQRGGKRAEAAHVLALVAHLLRSRDTALIFPEGGRSRSGRVDPEAAATGVGRVIRSVPGCRVLCVYLRGRKQEGYSAVPLRGDRFDVSLREIEPKTDFDGLRGSRDLVRQVVRTLHEMEREHFDDRQ